MAFMKLFCAYAFTGEDIAVLTKRMKMVVNTLSANGHDAYCNRFDPVIDKLQEQGDTKGIFQEAFKKIRESQAVVAIVTSPNRSIGQIMEIGVAMSQGKPVFLFESRAASGSSYLPQLADRHFVWENLEDLRQSLQNI